MTVVLAISGSLNEGSANTWLLDQAAAVAPDGVDVVPSISVGDVPHFVPYVPRDHDSIADDTTAAVLVAVVAALGAQPAQESTT